MAQRPAPQSFPITAGENVQLEFTVTDNDGTAVDLTGGSGQFGAARKVGAALAISSAASPQTATISVVSAEDGTVNVLIDDSVTDSLQGDYLYEFKWTDSSGNEATVAWGWISVYDTIL